MNRSVVSMALVFILTLMVMALAGCQPAADTNRNATATAAPTPTVDKAGIEAEVLKLDRDWFKAGETYDVQAIKRIVANDAILVYPDGTPGTKVDEVNIAETKAVTGEGWEMLESKGTVLSADSAFVTGRFRLKKVIYKDPGTKKITDLSGEYRFLNVYARRNGTWQVAASQATKILVPAPAASPTASR